MMNEFVSRPITVGDYLHARDLMVNERGCVWNKYESGGFDDDRLGELIEAYDLVTDTLTCLAMDLDKKNKA